MRPRCALIVDKDKGFANRLARCLGVAGIGADIVDSRRDALERVAQGPPAILFLAVEQPKRAGFALFSDVKRLARQMPVVLVTSTVPKAEMLLHQKLRIHADAYLDKRELDEAAMLDVLNSLLSLDLGADEVEPSVESESLEPALATLLAELGADAPGRETPPDRPLVAESDARVDALDDDPELHDRLETLERKLEVARQAARSSPFSTDFLALAERADHAERSATGLRRELDGRARLVEQQRGSLIQVASRLLDAERERRDATERIRTLEAHHAATQEELRRAHETIAALESRLSAERQRAEDEARSQTGTLAALEQQLAAAQQRAAESALDAECRHAEQQAALGQRHAQALAHERERALSEREATRTELAAELQRRAAEAIQARDAEWQRSVDELQRQHASAVGQLREEHRRELCELHDSLEKTLERTERQTAADLLAIADEHEQKFEQATEDWRTRLAQAEQALRSASREVSTSQERRIEELEQRHRETVDELRAQHTAERESLNREMAQRTAAHEKALADQARRHDEDLTQAVEKLRGELIREGNRRLDEIEQAERRRRADLAAQEQRYREEIELLNKLHEVESDRHANEREAALAELSRGVRAEPAPSPGGDAVKQAIDALDAECRTPGRPPAAPVRTDEVVRRSRRSR
jgi:FixJ family two-component response regulator